MKQKLVSILLVLCMVVALVPAIALTSAAANGVALPDGATAYDGTPSESLSGEGTEDSPFIIANTADFMYFYNTLAATATAGQVFKMTDDVYWNAKDSTKYLVSSKNFAGILDGNGHTVYNAFYSSFGSQTVFGTVTGTICNLTFDGSSIAAGNGSVGGVCVSIKGGTVDNVHLKNATISGQNIGGIANSISGNATVSNCSVEGTLSYFGTNQGCIGGIVSSISSGESGTIENCINRASITDKSSKVNRIGGVIGAAWSDGSSIVSLKISNCQNYGDIYETMSADKGGAGGILGASSRLNNLLIENCANYGSIQTAALGGTGGILGYCTYKNSVIVINGCQTAANITSTGNCVGGLIGAADALQKELTIKNCAVTGTISGVDNVGGVVGSHATDAWTGNNIIIVNSYVNADVISSGSYAGLAIGQHKVNNAGMTATVQNCVVMGTVTANTDAGAVLGMLTINDGHSKSFAPKVSLANSFVKATVIAGAEGKAATLVGGANSSVTDITLTSTDAAILVTVKVGETEVASPVTYYIGAGDGMTADIAVLDVNALTNKTAVAKLNAYATENSFAEWVQGANAPELTLFYVAPEVPEITIDGASLTIGGNVTMNLFVKKTTVAAAGVTLGKISIVDNGNKSYEVTDDSGDYYVFTIKGIHASEFGKNKIYHVQYTTADAPGTPIDCTATKEYSPLQYAINMYGKTDKAGLDALLLSIVNYADAAAGTTTAKAAFDEKNAGADWTAVTALTEIVKEDKDSGSYSYDAKTMPGIGARLTETIELTVYLKDTAYTGVTMKVGDTELTGTADEAAQTVKFEGFWATDLYNEITLTFTGAEGTEPLEATTSLVQYLNRYAGNETYAKVATATAQYLYAARLFCLNNQPNA